MPKDTNHAGTIFGGVILSNIDLAGAVEAHRLCPGHTYVTVAMDRIAFHQPVYVGDLISFYAEVTKEGKTSVTVKVDVQVRRREDPEREIQVTEAEVVFVAVDEQRRPVPIRG